MAQNISDENYEDVVDNLFDTFGCNVADYVFLHPQTNLPSNCITNVVTRLGDKAPDTAQEQVAAITGALKGFVFYLIKYHNEKNLATPWALFNGSGVISKFVALTLDFGGSEVIINVKNTKIESATNLEEYYTNAVSDIEGALIKDKQLVI